MLYKLWFCYVPVVSKTLATNVETTNPKQNLKRILWRNVTVPNDRIWNITTENVSYLSLLMFTMLSWSTYLLVVSPFDSEHAVEEWLSGPFLSRSAIFTLIIVDDWLVSDWRKCCFQFVFSGQLQKRCAYQHACISCSLTWSTSMTKT